MPPEAALADEHEDDKIDAGAEGGEGEGQDAAPKESSEEAVKVAKLMGWKPKSEWKGDTANWRPAEDFLAEVPEVMRNTRKAKDRLEGQVNRIVGQLAKLENGVNKQADAETRKTARELMEAGKYDEAEKILTESRAAPKTDEHPEFTAFKDRNEWFGVDDEATAYAEALDKRLAKEGISDPAAHMKKVEAGVKKAFPDLFEDGGKGGERETDRAGRRAPLVTRGNGRAERVRSSDALTVADMTPAQRNAAKTMGVSDKDWCSSYNKWKGA